MGKGERLLCTVCRNQLPLTEYNFIDENPIDRIFYGRTRVKKANSFLFFTKNGIVKNLIHHLKYKNQQQIGTFLGDWFGQLLKEQQQIDFIDAIVPVPLHVKKLRKRGYNQLTYFGERLGYHLRADYVPNVLLKTANTKTQTKKSRIYRWQSDKALFTISDPTLLKNKNVLLIDDIVTTGATLEACARTLNEVDGISLYIATMAVVA
ncbi:ComF family protein [Flavobacteriaceae bacterium F89]|uniref:ComF family protein n=1 Tax=Cerina litoralis TaxID=2874477 RepID=A0AAE3JNQ1_9FLAO|nr:phosphoribosyltransferase family protein [Cerina litoralis]MCG2460141.1 ComF family protein [Cerina litoralis]